MHWVHESTVAVLLVAMFGATCCGTASLRLYFSRLPWPAGIPHLEGLTSRSRSPSPVELVKSLVP